jgi:hypothetical protein
MKSPLQLREKVFEGYLGRLWAGHVTEGGSLLIEVEGEGVESAVRSTQVGTPSTPCR